MLGVDFEAGEDEIRNAYRRLAMKWHPDRHHGGSGVSQEEATEHFKLIGEAYHVLGDPERRDWYDNNAEIDVSELNLEEFLARFKQFILTNQWLDMDCGDLAELDFVPFTEPHSAPDSAAAPPAKSVPAKQR